MDHGLDGTGCQGVKWGKGGGHTDEGQVDYLEKPRWDFGAKDDPTVVLIVARNENRSA